MSVEEARRHNEQPWDAGVVDAVMKRHSMAEHEAAGCIRRGSCPQEAAISREFGRLILEVQAAIPCYVEDDQCGMWQDGIIRECIPCAARRQLRELVPA